jgi:hypothetical protein
MAQDDKRWNQPDETRCPDLYCAKLNERVPWNDLEEAEMMRTMLVCIAIMFVPLLSGAADKPQVYRNPEFGITLRVPDGVKLCPSRSGEHDHGPVLVLDPSNAKASNDAKERRIIEVFASFNAVEASKTLDKFLESECGDTGKGGCLPVPANLRVGEMQSAAGRVNNPNGWIDIFVVTQAGKPDPAFNASVPSVNYVLQLHTDKEHSEADLGTFRRVLRTIQLSPAQ